MQARPHTNHAKKRWLAAGFFVGVFGAVMPLGCGGSLFACQYDTDCTRDGSQGRCEPTGWCSFENDACPSGWQYGSHAAAGLAGECVMPSADTGDTSTTQAEGSSTTSDTFTSTTGLTTTTAATSSTGGSMSSDTTSLDPACQGCLEQCAADLDCPESRCACLLDCAATLEPCTCAQQCGVDPAILDAWTGCMMRSCVDTCAPSDCGGTSTTGPGDGDPYGPCNDALACGLPEEQCVSTQDGTVCSLPCESDDDCPVLDNNASVACVDPSQNPGSPGCVVLCQFDECPTGMKCGANGFCLWP